MRNNTAGRRVLPPMDRWSVVRAIVLGVLMAAVISTVLLTDFLRSNQVVLNAGDVSTEDILAPSDLTYESEIRTKQAQETRATSVEDIYDPPDASIARQQQVRARQILDYVSTVRQDPYASFEQKTTWLAAIPDLSLSTGVVSQTLSLSESDWQEVREETIRVLLRAMQGEIRESQLAGVRRRLPTLISHGLNDDQAEVVRVFAGGLVTANTFFNAARTEEARQKAREDTPPMTVTVRRGEAIVRAGSRVRPEDIEALEAFGLRQQATRWQSVVGTIVFALLATILLGLLILRLRPTLWSRGRTSIITFLLLATFVAVGKLMLPVADSVIPHFYPLPALSMTLTVLFGPALGLALGVMVGLIGVFAAGASLEMTVYLLAGTLIGVLALGQTERLRSFLRAGLAVALTNAAVILLFGLLAPEQDMLKVSINAVVGVVAGGMAASLTLAAFFALSALLDVITPFQLMDLSRPTHPLFRRLLLKAPGTYHHTLLVSNMAEEAAERIGADGLLTRVGTYYHDIGKTVRPYFFTENRVGDINPHERLDPRTSAQIIISHVQDGLDLAEKYHLPSAIRAFIPEHQGTGLTLYFYRMAVKEAGDDGDSVREEDFRYPGPKPQSRETAIAMLADSCEARVRSARPSSLEEMDRIIQDTIESKVDEGQLDESDLTLRDLKEIRETFLSVLQGVFHPRVKYPEPVKVKGPDGQEAEV
ncbi:MAG: HDIG domain-containing protein [Anaerolineae bacterium]